MYLWLDGTRFPIQFAAASKKRRRLLSRAGIDRAAALATMYESYPDVKEYFLLPEQERPPMTDTLALHVVTYNSVYADIEEEFSFRVLRGIIDLDALTQEQRVVVQSPIESEFWDAQNPEEVAAYVQTFLGIGRGSESADRGDAADLGDSVAGSTESRIEGTL